MLYTGPEISDWIVKHPEPHMSLKLFVGMLDRCQRWTRCSELSEWPLSPRWRTVLWKTMEIRTVEDLWKTMSFLFRSMSMSMFYIVLMA